MVHAYNLRYLGSGDWEDGGLRPVQTKLVRPPAQLIKLGVMAHACRPHYTGSISRRIAVPDRQNLLEK
jgi:hypothetical protein